MFTFSDIPALSSAMQASPINSQTLAVIVNTNDPASVEIAEYYQRQRAIPDEHIVRLAFSADEKNMSVAEFSRLQQQVLTELPETIRAYALTWTMPYRVDCMSITSAFALGFNADYCASGCNKTRPVEYNQTTNQFPKTIRPAMMLAGETVDAVKALIDRGIASDHIRPDGTAYLLSTSDRNRNVRAVQYPQIQSRFSTIRSVQVIESNSISNKPDVLFYFTGLKRVEDIDTNHYQPGAVADHLTSAGGVLPKSNQMSVLDWLQAGATGSYGAVVEPCNFPEKFPNPGLLMTHYLNGDPLVAAYWKSVRMPGQGLFVGEPLASPFGGCRLVHSRQGAYRFANRPLENYVFSRSRRCD